MGAGKSQFEEQQTGVGAENGGRSILSIGRGEKGGSLEDARTPRVRKRFGKVHVSVKSHGNTDIGDDCRRSHVVDCSSAVFHGKDCNPDAVQFMSRIGRRVSSRTPAVISVPHAKAHSVLVAHTSSLEKSEWHVIPSKEVFSRHSGTCCVVGDKTSTSPHPYHIQIGDCIRFGSVGLVVSELKVDGCEPEKFDEDLLHVLEESALQFDGEEDEDMAILAAEEAATLADSEYDEEEKVQISDSIDSISDLAAVAEIQLEVGGEGSFSTAAKNENTDTDSTETSAELNELHERSLSEDKKYFCYMCYESDDPDSGNPLIAPCNCRGDTRYLHAECMQKWYYASVSGRQAQVIRQTGYGAPACKICGAAYKLSFRDKLTGHKQNLLVPETNRPYLSLVVVSQHDTAQTLFRTRFRISFAGDRGGSSSGDTTIGVPDSNTITIGRSNSCNMILDYRTVSTNHAKIVYKDGNFLLEDNASSNGTMVFVQRPIPLPWGRTVPIRIGRTTLSMTAQRDWWSELRYCIAKFGKRNALRTDFLKNPYSSEHVSDMLKEGPEKHIVNSLKHKKGSTEENNRRSRNRSMTPESKLKDKGRLYIGYCKPPSSPKPSKPSDVAPALTSDTAAAGKVDPVSEKIPEL